MENTTIQNLGKLYRLLDKACNPDRVNQADLDSATRFPVRGVMMKITLAHKLHKMTPELDNACAYVLKDVDIEDVDSSFALKALSMQQQGVFQIGYMSPDYKTLGVSAVKIKAARESAGLTIRALSEKTGLSTATIQHAEAGKPTRMKTLEKIAAACNVSAEDLQG
ncbi:MAG: helix-turn-helix transcriptional regulator [Faecalibacterium prausnitzii]|nr:helix-turn-helix transcriptional regulator [Faecalibacterium prausnitzii]